MIGLQVFRIFVVSLPFADALATYRMTQIKPPVAVARLNTTRCIEINATACNSTVHRLGDADSCVVDGTDIILSFHLGRPIFRHAMLDVIQVGQREVWAQLNQVGNRVLRDSEIPWTESRQGLTVTATTPGRGPRLLTYEVLLIALQGLYECGYRERKYQEMLTSIWDTHGNFYTDINLLNRSPHATQ